MAWGERHDYAHFAAHCGDEGSASNPTSHMQDLQQDAGKTLEA